MWADTFILKLGSGLPRCQEKMRLTLCYRFEPKVREIASASALVAADIVVNCPDSVCAEQANAFYVCPVGQYKCT